MKGRKSTISNSFELPIDKNIQYAGTLVFWHQPFPPILSIQASKKSSFFVVLLQLLIAPWEKWWIGTRIVSLHSSNMLAILKKISELFHQSFLLLEQSSPTFLAWPPGRKESSWEIWANGHAHDGGASTNGLCMPTAHMLVHVCMCKQDPGVCPGGGASIPAHVQVGLLVPAWLCYCKWSGAHQLFPAPGGQHRQRPSTRWRTIVWGPLF